MGKIADQVALAGPAGQDLVEPGMGGRQHLQGVGGGEQHVGIKKEALHPAPGV